VDDVERVVNISMDPARERLAGSLFYLAVFFHVVCDIFSILSQT